MTAEAMERERLLKPYLRSDERLLWTGLPKQGLLLTGWDAFLIPFSLLWGGFAIFWEATAIYMGGPAFMALFGIPFVLVGLFMIFGRFIADAAIRRGMVYGLTDKRAIVLKRTFGQSVTTTPLDGAIRISRQGDRGTIRFGAFSMGVFFATYAYSLWMPSLTGATVFLAIEDPDRVYALANGA